MPEKEFPNRKIVVVGSYADSLINFRGPLLRSMVAAGHSVIACAPDAAPEVKQTLQSWGVIYRPIEMQRTGLNPLKDVRTLAALVRIFKEVRPDIVLSYTIKPVIYGMLAARIASVKQRAALITGLGYTFMDETLKQNFLKRVVCRLYRSALKNVSVVFFQNSDDLDLFRKLSLVGDKTEQVVVNGSGVDVSCFERAPLPEKPAFLMIARLLKEKGVREYVQAAKIVREQYPETVFHLVGWIDDAPSAVTPDELEAWQREGIIRFWGKLSDVRPAIRECSVYVLPSYREGAPRTVLEAMAMGRAVITTDAPGCRQTVEPGQNGLLVEAKNVDSLAEAMRHFIFHPEAVRTMGARSALIARERYDVHRVNDVMLSKLRLA